MGGKDLGYDVIHRGVTQDIITPGKWIFIQRAKLYGGGWWFGRAYHDVFMFEFDQPTSLGAGIDYILAYGSTKKLPQFDDDFQLEP